MATFVFKNSAEATNDGSSQLGEKKYTQKDLDNAAEAARMLEHERCKNLHEESIKKYEDRIRELRKELEEAKEKAGKKAEDHKNVFTRSFVGKVMSIIDGKMFIDGVPVNTDDNGNEVEYVNEVHITGNVERVNTQSASVEVKGDVTRVNTMSGSVNVSGKCDRVSTMSGSIIHR